MAARPDERRRVVALSTHATLWFVLIQALVVVLVVPDAPVATSNPTLAVTLSTLAGVVGLVLVQIGVVRFLVLGYPIDLFAGLAFAPLALANLGVRVLALAAGRGEPQEIGLCMTLGAQFMAAALLLAGISQGGQVPPSLRRRRAMRLGSLVVLVVGLGAAALVRFRHDLPRAVDAATREALVAGRPVVDALPGQEPWLLLANGTIALLFLAATVGYVVSSRRYQDPHISALALAVTLLFFGQINALLAPSIAAQYVTTADLIRTAAYLVLAFSLVGRMCGDIAERAVREERLRLSRELHDGLAQQLSLLNLLINRASAPGRPWERRVGELESARRLVEQAVLEARHAITSLRTGVLSWEEFSRTLASFVEEFSQNHEVQVHLTREGSAGRIEAELQVEILRTLHELFSNAVRHGEATRLHVALVALPGRINMRVHDNGKGFDPSQPAAPGGVGLQSLKERIVRRGGSLALRSEPGEGATIDAVIPLTPQQGVPI